MGGQTKKRWAVSATWTWSRLRLRKPGRSRNSSARRRTKGGKVAENMEPWTFCLGRWDWMRRMSG
jgi:hypothetical protein